MHNRYLPFISWAICILALFGLFLYSWQEKSQPQVEQTGFSIAKRQILAAANNYKELWLLHGSFSPQYINGKKVYFTDSGWPYSYSEILDCQQWFELLWDKEDVLWLNYLSNELIIDNENNKRCRYMYQHGYSLDLEIIGTQFNVIDQLAE